MLNSMVEVKRRSAAGEASPRARPVDAEVLLLFKNTQKCSQLGAFGLRFVGRVGRRR